MFEVKTIPAFQLLALVLMLLFSNSQLIGQSLKDTIQLNEVIVEGSRTFRREKAGSTETRIDTSLLKSMQTLSLSELISESTPIFIKNYGRGSMASASFRGTSPSHTQVRWNGISLNSPMLGMVDFSLIPVYFFDEAVLKHGSSSLEDLEGALGGSIVLSNKPNWENRFSGKVLGSIASFSTYDGFLRLNKGTSTFQSQTRLFSSISKNDFEYVNPLNADLDPRTGAKIFKKEKNENSDWKNFGILQELYFRIKQNQQISARFWGQTTNRSIPMLATRESKNSNNLNQQEDRTAKCVVAYENFGNFGILKVQSALNYSGLKYSLKNNIGGTGIFIYQINSTSDTYSVLNNAEYSVVKFQTFRLSAAINADYHSVENYEAVKLTGYAKSRSELGAKVQLNWSLSPRFNANFILRESVIGNEAALPSIMTGFDYMLIRNEALIINGRIAKNYHQPTLNDLYFQPGGNPNLRPEEEFTFDIGFKWKCKFNHSAISGSLNTYKSNVRDWIIWLPTFYGGWEPSNIGKVNITGVEGNIALNGNWNKLGYKLISNYSMSHSINNGDKNLWSDNSIGKQLPYIPVHSANAAVILTTRNWFASYSWNYYSERFTTTSNEKMSRRDELYPYFMSNISLRKEYQFASYLCNIECKVQNLFNESYRTVLQRMMPGRNYALSLTLNF